VATIVGSGEHRYRIVEDWAELPDGWSFKGVGAVGTDANDNLYVFNRRGEHPMMVFDRPWRRPLSLRSGVTETSRSAH